MHRLEIRSRLGHHLIDVLTARDVGIDHSDLTGVRQEEQGQEFDTRVDIGR